VKQSGPVWASAFGAVGGPSEEIVEVRACVRGAEALEVAWEDHEVEVWEKEGCAERIERAPFLDPEAARAFADEIVLDAFERGFTGGAPPRFDLRRDPRLAQARASPDRERVVAEWLSAEGHPHALFLRALHDGLATAADRLRVHEAVFDDWEPGMVGARWRGGFVEELTVQVSRWTASRIAPGLQDLLRRPALWFVERVVIRGAPVTVRTWVPPGERHAADPDDVRDWYLVPGDLVGPILAALDRGAPPSVRWVAVWGDTSDVDPEIERSLASRAELSLTHEGPPGVWLDEPSWPALEPLSAIDPETGSPRGGRVAFDDRAPQVVPSFVGLEEGDPDVWIEGVAWDGFDAQSAILALGRPFDPEEGTDEPEPVVIPELELVLDREDVLSLDELWMSWYTPPDAGDVLWEDARGGCSPDELFGRRSGRRPPRPWDAAQG
jgi:hypothetical protein